MKKRYLVLSEKRKIALKYKAIKARTLALSGLINFFTMPNTQSGNNKLFIFNETNKPIISNSIPPLPLKISLESFPVYTWILTVHQMFGNP